MSALTAQTSELDEHPEAGTPQPLPFSDWPCDWKQVFHDTYDVPFPIDVERAFRIILDREHAEDATQDAGRKLSNVISIGRLDTNHCFPSNDGKIKARPWYVSVHKHTSLDALRKLIRERKRGESASTFDVPNADGETRALDMDDLPFKASELSEEKVLELARIHLPKGIFQIFELASQGYSQVEIGQRLKLTIDQIKGRLRRARPIFQKILRQQGFK